VLEINDDRYTKRFGGGRVEHSDILHPVEGNPDATVVADLADAGRIADGAYDCVICTQTLLYVFDIRGAIATLHRIVAPGGVVLAAVPGISRLNQADNDAWGDWWRFTAQSIRRLFGEAFAPEAVDAEAHGNVLTAAAQLYGIAADELTAEELDHRDPNYEVVLTLRAERR
jgi:SAM-dependent methyltransferase